MNTPPLRPARSARALRRAFTLVEMMIVVSIIGIIALLVAPNMAEMIGMQRLRSINDQLITDMQALRSESVSRNQIMGFLARNTAGEPMTCYSIISGTSNTLSLPNIGGIDKDQCNCTNAVGSVCTGTQRELRTVQLPRDSNIQFTFHPDQRGFVVLSPIASEIVIADPNTAVFQDVEFCVEVRRTPRGRLRTTLGAAGRVSQCSPDGSVPGVALCPAYDVNLGNCKAVP
ncbi:MAG: prepilin-type N-terminal cleavage/methylation domain-containing protein [Rubrivivax sp.]|nr:prepilin-type N-terminal cleavage/methylation domain-containing protein [Rubrivivax sp.]